MVGIGCFLSSEEQHPARLLEIAGFAERAGFEGLWISDHYHPWTSEQGHSPFVWAARQPAPGARQRVRPEGHAARPTHVFVQQIDPDQEGFMHFYADEVLPRLR